MAHKVDYELYEKVKTLGDDWNSPTVEVHHYKTFPLENTDDLQVLEINGATKIESKILQDQSAPALSWMHFADNVAINFKS